MAAVFGSVKGLPAWPATGPGANPRGLKARSGGGGGNSATSNNTENANEPTVGDENGNASALLATTTTPCPSVRSSLSAGGDSVARRGPGGSSSGTSASTAAAAAAAATGSRRARGGNLWCDSPIEFRLNDEDCAAGARSGGEEDGLAWSSGGSDAESAGGGSASARSSASLGHAAAISAAAARAKQRARSLRAAQQQQKQLQQANFTVLVPASQNGAVTAAAVAARAATTPCTTLQHPHHPHPHHPAIFDGAPLAASRRYVRDIVVATNSAADGLARYKALMSLVESVKGAAAALGAGGGAGGNGLVSPASVADWGREPAAGLLHAVADVGEALAGFGNNCFPSHSAEARAVSAADYRKLLEAYLRAFGRVLAAAEDAAAFADGSMTTSSSSSNANALPGASPEAAAELRAVGTLLATRCAAYEVLYEQLVRAVGNGNGGGGGGGSGSNGLVCIFNNNWNKVTAAPVARNVAAALTKAKAQAQNAGIGAAALAVAALGAGLLMRVALRHSGVSSSGSGSSSRSARDAARRALPRGRGGRELALAAALAECGDELRKAAHNDTLLRDDWRIGRSLRLGWPLPAGPVPDGYAPLKPDACDLARVLGDVAYGPGR